MLETLKPERVFYYFEEISKIPRASWHTGEIASYLENFAAAHQLSCQRDEYDNIAIFKKASPGYEELPAVILQGHTDMVAEQEEDWHHDFQNDGICLRIKDDYVLADHTTLGADDGIAIAYALAILEDDSLPHPPLEVLLTSNEEVALTGAENLDPSMIRGKYLINLDSEEEGFLLCGCAGGINVETHIPVRYTDTTARCFNVTLSGLKGGHSGQEISKPRANANKLMGRFLFELKEKFPCLLVSLKGGQKHNVIAAGATAVIALDSDTKDDFTAAVKNFQDTLRREYAGEDDGVTVQCTDLGEQEVSALHPVSMEKVIFFLTHQPHGVIKMSGTVSNMPETSANAAVVSLDEEEFFALTSIRSSLESAKEYLGGQIGYLTEFLGGEYVKNAGYPAWEYEEHSPLRDLACRVYQEMFQKPLPVVNIHAGLECGLLKDKAPHLDCISLGPDILDIHSPRERLCISSTKRMWEFLLALLENMKTKF